MLKEKIKIRQGKTPAPLIPTAKPLFLFKLLLTDPYLFLNHLFKKEIRACSMLAFEKNYPSNNY